MNALKAYTREEKKNECSKLRVGKFFCKRPESKYFRVSWPRGNIEDIM